MASSDAVGNRLSVRQRTKIDDLRDSVPKPPGYIPENSLPTWEYMLLEQKLPSIPTPETTQIYFTRGQLAKSMIRPTVVYSTADPANRVRVPTNKCELLHLPCARKYFLRNDILKQLKNHNLVNDKNEVLCSIKEFNRFRLYLSSLYNDEVRKKLEAQDELLQYTREQDRAFFRQQQEEEGGKLAVRNERTARAKRFKQEALEQQRKRQEQNDRDAYLRRQQLMEERQQAQAARMMQSEERMETVRNRIMKLREMEDARKKEILHKTTLKDMQSEANREHVEKTKKIEYEKKLKHWFDAKLLSASERLDREKEIQAEHSDSMKQNAKRRQQRIEKSRAELPDRIQKKKAEGERLDKIVRKFAMRWLNRVRERLNKPRDEKHESVFYSQTKNVLQDSMKQLIKDSGYEKLDDVVMNIMKFKEALKKQLAAEEAEEEEEDAAAAAEAARNE
ncbi:Fibrous sheath-interacting protein 2 [Orchesella cincta]|uniref:Fibrous sheath-interacting protein 2 n=1 Tax=Orchesella cincta TaxID=48709 RepID=A0A1D2NL92_ORCCI|nr:Fibrous sheath-interacting protein 2 [Orchesella cincta]